MFREKIFKQALELYAGRHVAEFVDALDGKVGLGGYKVDITSYLQDLYGVGVNFNIISPHAWNHFLQEYLNASCESVLAHNGTLDDVRGESVKAFWGAPTAQNDHARLGVAAAIASIKLFREVQAEFTDPEIKKFRLSVALCGGSAIVGNFGCKYRYNYTALGETVKSVTRIQPLALTYDVGIMATTATYEPLQSEIAGRELDRILFPYTDSPVCIYEIKGFVKDSSDMEQELLDEFNSGVRQFRQRRWDEASDHFFAVLKMQKDDRPSQLYVERCTHYKNNPPQSNWDGTIVPQMERR